jgi:two-component system, chemotaxis family, chemotaxis protein CheY
MSKKVLLVGHCSPDSSYLTLAVRSVCPEASVHRVNNDTALLASLEAGCDLLLVNRMLDGDFKDYSGITLVSRCRKFKPTIPVILVSNYADAQAEAIAAGALPGFGKAELGHQKAKEALAAVLAKPT